MRVRRPTGFGRALVAALLFVSACAAQATITLYEDDGFRGRAVTLNGAVPNLKALGFNDLASSAIVEAGRWLACEHDHFRGRCVIFQVGSHASLRAIGMNDLITSVRPYRRGVDDHWELAIPQPDAYVYPYYQRPGERLYEAPVVYVRAITGPPEQRCWVEHRPATAGNPNLGGAVVGAIIGGIIGHQIGSGRGNDIATAVGAVAGAAIGAQAGGGSLGVPQEIRRCDSAPSGQIAYYEVGYTFRGQDHTVHMTYPPGPTIRVNARGEPRQ
ncbi:MAG: beta/gamma crystallin family protein [Casimicrobiaceae bacterium]|nr:beta/gamma crystallin family protein [Casimicrobiaceae bacterium]MDW8311559.1 beta/gamma crystallin family protein [Burkholderiales bacterium]